MEEGYYQSAANRAMLKPRKKGIRDIQVKLTISLLLLYRMSFKDQNALSSKLDPGLTYHWDHHHIDFATFNFQSTELEFNHSNKVHTEFHS